MRLLVTIPLLIIMNLSQSFRHLRSDIDKVLSSTEMWQLPLNESKCKVLHIGNGNPPHKHTLHDKSLGASSMERDLGVQMDQELKFRKQAAATVAKASKIMGVIKRSFKKKLDRDTLPIPFKTVAPTP